MKSNLWSQGCYGAARADRGPWVGSVRMLPSCLALQSMETEMFVAPDVLAEAAEGGLLFQ